MIKIEVAKEFTDTPGTRYKRDKIAYSGEEFRENILFPKYIECLHKNETLLVDLDGGYGYFYNFLEEAFGGLIRKLKAKKMDIKKPLKIIVIKSNDEEGLIERIQKYMTDEINKKDEWK